MSDDKKARAPTITRLHSAEVNGMYMLYAAWHDFSQIKQMLEKRLRTIPGGWRDFSLVVSVMSKLIDKLLQTIPQDKLISMSRNMKHMSYRVYLVRPVTPPEDEIVVDADDLAALAKYSHQYACLACNGNCDKCSLGKALDHTMVQSRERGESWAWISCDTE